LPKRRVLDKYDVIVIGGGPGGIPAAIAAARQGRKTLLVERNAFLGGVAATGLPLLAFFDRTGNQVVGGIADEIVKRLEAVGGSFHGHIPCPLHNSFTPVNPFLLRGVVGEMCEEAGVDIMLAAEVEDVAVDSGRIVGTSIFSRAVTYDVACDVLIDATGDGTAAHLAGAEYRIGTEDDSRTQPVSLVFTVGNVDIEQLLDYIKRNPDTFKTPSTYGPGMEYSVDYFLDSESFYFTGFGEFIEEAKANGDFDIPRDRIIFARQPNQNEVVVNATRILDIDPTSSMSMTKAEMEGQRQVRMLVAFFRKYCPGFRNAFLANTASNTYARESRRVTGISTVTQRDIDELAVPADSVALAGYNIDIHQEGHGLNFMPAQHAVGIPFGCMVSKNIDGLLTSGRCISVDPYPFGLTRAMSTCMAVGEAAGTAAAMSLAADVTLRDLDVNTLRDELVDNGAILSLASDVSTPL